MRFPETLAQRMSYTEMLADPHYDTIQFFADAKRECQLLAQAGRKVFLKIFNSWL